VFQCRRWGGREVCIDDNAGRSIPIRHRWRLKGGETGSQSISRKARRGQGRGEGGRLKNLGATSFARARARRAKGRRRRESQRGASQASCRRKKKKKVGKGDVLGEGKEKGSIIAAEGRKVTLIERWPICGRREDFTRKIR